MRKVGIIGGSGFIGSYITQSFLDNGFEVKVGVTDISQPQKYTHLTELPHADYLQIVEVKAEETDQVRHFIQDCDVLIHGGTPFQLDVLEPQKELLDPTIQGTKKHPRSG
jgi:dihydroflavonol-4-reductase